MLRVAIGDTVAPGQPLLDLHASEPGKLAAARAVAMGAVTIGGPITSTALIRARVTPDGVVHEA